LKTTWPLYPELYKDRVAVEEAAVARVARTLQVELVAPEAVAVEEVVAEEPLLHSALVPPVEPDWYL
jgi:hypothetical protein